MSQPLRKILVVESRRTAPDPLEREDSAVFVHRRARRGVIIGGLLFYLLAIFVRLPGFRVIEPNPDEVHWVTRSAQIANRLGSGDYGSATTHLGHPGIPAAFAMMIGQLAAERWNHALAAAPGTRYYVDSLAGARLANIFVSSLLFPILFVFCSVMFSPLVAATASGLMLFECQNLALTRIAHIDGFLTLFVGMSVMAYALAEQRRSVPWKIAAGIFWGCAIATKPTAAALVGVFFLYRCFRSMLTPPGSERRALLGWSDLWAVLIGHLVLGATYTKLWNPANTYLTKHHIDPWTVYRIAAGSDLAQRFPVLPNLLLLILIPVACLAWTRRRSGMLSRSEFHLSMATLLIGACAFLAIVYPVTTGNMLRFWSWVGGLSRRKHEAYGVVWRPPSGGYGELWLRRLPDIAIIGVMLFFLTASSSLRKRFRDEQLAFAALCLVMPFVWTAPLALSSKQTIRYAQPVYPFVMILAALGFVGAARVLAERDWAKKLRVNMKTLTIGAGCVVPILSQALVTLHWRPYSSTYFNTISGGTKGAVRSGLSLGAVGYLPVLEELQNLAVRTGEKQRLEIIGDFDLLLYAYRRLVPDSKRRFVELSPYEGGSGSDWLITFPYFLNRVGITLDRDRLEEVRRMTMDGAEVYTLYRILPAEIGEAKRLEVRLGRWQTGRPDFDSSGHADIVANPAHARRGYLLFDLFVRTIPGRYTVAFPLALEPWEETPSQPIAPEEEVVTLEFGSECKRQVTYRELTSSFQDFTLDCDVAAGRRVQTRVYWFGKVPVRLTDLKIGFTPKVAPPEASESAGPDRFQSQGSSS